MIAAPFDGCVTNVAETRHAIGLQSDDGIKVLLHVGVDTVSMDGKGFQVYVKPGERVWCGQRLLTFSRKDIAEAGLADTITVLVINSGDYQSITPLTGSKSLGEKMMEVK